MFLVRSVLLEDFEYYQNHYTMRYISFFGEINPEYKSYLFFQYDWYFFNVRGFIDYVLMAFELLETTNKFYSVYDQTYQSSRNTEKVGIFFLQNIFLEICKDLMVKNDDSPFFLHWIYRDWIGQSSISVVLPRLNRHFFGQRSLIVLVS